MMKLFLTRFFIPTFCIGLYIFTTPLAVSAEVKESIALLPLERWFVSAAEGQEASISEDSDSLRIDFDVAIDHPHRVGHEVYNTGVFDVLLKDPITLPDGSDRITFEAIGSELKAWNERDKQIRLRVLIEDERGEILVYNAFPDEPFHFSKGHPSYKKQSTRWRRWATRQFQTSEAGAATQDIFETRFAGGNYFPDGRLKFIGFEVEVRDRKPDTRRSGSLILGSVTILGGMSPSEDPWFYADAVCEQAGEYTLEYEVTNNFQALPIGGASKKFYFDPEDSFSRRKQLIFKTGPSDNYWIRYNLIGPDGAVVEANRFRTQIYDRDGPPLKTISAEKPPYVGMMRINPTDNKNGVYSPEEPLKVTIRIYANEVGAEAEELKWELMGYEFPEILHEGQIPVQLPQKGFEDIELDLSGMSERSALRLRLKLLNKGKIVDKVLYHLGRETVFDKTEHPEPGPLCHRDYIKGGSYNRITITKLSTVRFHTEDEAIEYYQERMDEIRRITPNITYMVDVRDIQTLPGVYNFDFLDRIMKSAKERAMFVTFRFGHIDDEGQFTWVKYSRQLNYNGREIPEHYYGGFSVTDTGYTDIWLDAFRAVYNHYGSHPAFQGYYILKPAGEFTVSDKPWEGLVSGYSPPMQKAFRSWLQEYLNLNLAQLNQRWSTDYVSWDQVQQPLPDFTLMKKPDLRQSWMDFCRFKAWLNNDYWQKMALTSIRSYDPWRVVINYSDPRRAQGLADYGHNGGNHYFEAIGDYIDTWYKHHTGWISEPHQPNKWTDYGDPKERGWVLDWTIWVAFAQAGAGGANLHVYYHPKVVDLLWHYGRDMGYDRMQRFFPILEEMHAMEIQMEDPQVAFLSDPSTLYTKHRTTFFQRLWDLKRTGELLDRDNVNYHRFYDNIDAAKIKGTKLIICNFLDEVLSGHNIDVLTKAVQEDGARLVITANSGKYSTAFPGETFVLLKRLGIETPQGDYDVEQLDVAAQPTIAGQDLFPDDQPLRFFTLADLKADMASEDMREREYFWSYPYRWLPVTDYFGVYQNNGNEQGQVLAQFPNGQAAVSLIPSGRGEVIVFWGLPDIKKDNMPGVMARIAKWAGAGKSVAQNALPLMREAKNTALERHYALIYNDDPGTFLQKINFLPDGEWFLDELVSDQRLGFVDGAVARTRGINLTFDETYSPLKILRFIPFDANVGGTQWHKKYPNQTAEN